MTTQSYHAMLATIETDLRALDERRQWLERLRDTVRTLLQEEPGDTGVASAPTSVPEPAPEPRQDTAVAVGDRRERRTTDGEARAMQEPSFTDQQLLAYVQAHQPVAPGQVCEHFGTTYHALRKRLAPLVAANQLTVAGTTTARRISLGRKALAPAPRPDSQMVTVWNGRREDPPLTEGVSGLGSTLGGSSFNLAKATGAKRGSL